MLHVWLHRLTAQRELLLYVPHLAPRTHTGHTVLHCACDCRNSEMVAALIKAGADSEAVNRRQRTSLQIAIGAVDKLKKLLNPEVKQESSPERWEELKGLLRGSSECVRLLQRDQQKIIAKELVDGPASDPSRPYALRDRGHQSRAWHHGMSPCKSKKKDPKAEDVLDLPRM